MYESITYEFLLKSMLDYASSQAATRDQQLDTREGSMLWYGQAPAAVEAQNLFIQLDTILKETFADTASRYYLIKRAAERGMAPKAATSAIGKAEFTPTTLDIPMGSRFNLNDLNFVLLDKMDNGVYQVQCETPGEIGNTYTGDLIPIEYIAGLETARLTEILIPGEDEQDTESFRQEYLDSFQSQAFGGNVADYKQKVNAIDGVGGVKVYRAWNSNLRPAELIPPETYETWFLALPEDTPAEIKTWLQKISSAAEDGLLTTGGTVRLVIIDSTFSAPSQELVQAVQTAIDPEVNHGEGLGMAPIGHVVTVEGVGETTINLATQLTYKDGWNWEAVQPYVEEVIDDYFEELSQTWEDDTEGLIVRISILESRILNCPGILDITGTTLNEQPENMKLEPDFIPVRGSVSET